MMECEWECNVCTLFNKITNVTCDACGNARPESMDTTTTNMGSFATDWSCPSCTYTNKGKDEMCVICNTFQGTDSASGSVNLPFVPHQGSKERPLYTESTRTEELRIVIIGKTGTGKSATGNTILGKSEFVSKVWGASVTSKCSLGMNVRLNRKMVVVDTPGLYDTGMTNEQVTKEIVKCIGMTAPGPHAILLTVNIGRFTKEEQDTVKHFVDHFGIGMYNYLMVVFTRADDLENENVNINDYVTNAPPALKAILHLCNNRFIPFNNKLTGNRQEQQVRDLISRIDDVVNRNGGCCYTNEMYEEAEKTLRRREEEVKRKLQEEKRRQVENVRRHLQSEFDEKFAKEQEEKERLENEIKHIEIEKQRADSRENEMKDQIAALHDQLKDCKKEEDKRNEEKELRIENMIKDMERKQAEHIQSQMNKANDDKIAQLQKQMADAESRRQKEIEEVKRENERRVKEIEEKYKKRTEPTTLRDNSRTDCEKEKGIFSQLWDVGKGIAKGVVDTVKKCVIS